MPPLRQTEDLLSQMIQTSFDLARLALHKQVDPLMLIEQQSIQFIFEGALVPLFIVSARDGDGFCVGRGSSEFDEMLELVVVDVI